MVSTHLKNTSQNGNLPQIGVKIKHIWNHQPVKSSPKKDLFLPNFGTPHPLPSKGRKASDSPLEHSSCQRGKGYERVPKIQLMVQKSGDHQLRLVVYPIIYDGFYTSQVVVWDFWRIYSKAHKTLRIFSPISNFQVNMESDNKKVFFCRKNRAIAPSLEMDRVMGSLPKKQQKFTPENGCLE